MLFTTLLSLAAVAVAAPIDATTQTTGRAHIFNHCTFDVNFWVNNQGNPQVIPAGGNWGEDFVPGGRSITIMTSPRLWSADPKITMGYTYKPDESSVWYDLYPGDGTRLDFPTPFQGFKVVQSSANSGCRSNVWNNGVAVPGDHVFDCASDRDVNLWLCAQ